MQQIENKMGSSRGFSNKPILNPKITSTVDLRIYFSSQGPILKEFKNEKKKSVNEQTNTKNSTESLQ